MDFPILKNVTYLDNAATTQKPIQVIDAITNFYKESKANIHRGIYDLSEKATIEYEKARATVANFINANTREIVFTSGTTAGINMLANSLQLNEGDEIILSILEHHSNILPWQKLAKQQNLTIKYIPIKEDLTLDLEKAKQLITEKTKIVAITHISNVTGTINDIKELTKITHEKNAQIVIDAAQSIAHMPIDVKELNVDYLFFSGHKMYGPTGIGVFYGKEQLLTNLQPSILGGGMVQEVTKDSVIFQDIPSKFEAGTPPIAQAIGLAAAVKYIQNIGLTTIQAEENEVAKYAHQKLSALENIKIHSPENSTVIAFTIQNIHPHDIAEILNRNNVAIRAGHHCAQPLHNSLNLQSTARISLALYNTKEDIDRLIQGLKQVQEVLA